MSASNTTCPACESVAALTVETLSVAEQFKLYANGDPEIFRNLAAKSGIDNESYEIRRCEHCGLHYSAPMKGASGEWYSYTYNLLNLHASDRWEFDFVADTIKKGERVGEIGCGTGVFLEKCKYRGNDVHGIDFSRTSVEACHQKGLKADLVDIHAIDVSLTNSRNVLASFHVLEHLEDPAFLFRIASNWAAPGATLWVSVPSDRRIDRILGQKQLLDEPPHHLTKWTPKALGAIGALHGWHLERMIDDEMGTRRSLHAFCVNSTFYKKIVKPIGDRNKWLDRLFRYAMYPFIFIRHGNRVFRLTGHAMMAEFVNRKNMDNRRVFSDS